MKTPGGDPTTEAASRSELVARINKLLDILSKQDTEKSRLSEVANSPFMVTFLGGVIVAALTLLIQSKTAEHDKAVVFQKQKYERKEKAAYGFADEMPLKLNLALRFKTREVWLKEQPGSNAVFASDGRSFTQTRDYYESCLDRYLAQRPVGSICSELIADFQSSPVRELAAAAISNVNKLVLATNATDVRQAFRDGNQNYQDLTKVLFKELSAQK